MKVSTKYTGDNGIIYDTEAEAQEADIIFHIERLCKTLHIPVNFEKREER